MPKSRPLSLDPELVDRLTALLDDVFRAGIEAGREESRAQVLKMLGGSLPSADSTSTSSTHAAKEPKASGRIAAPGEKVCKAQNCKRVATVKGLCATHYHKANRLNFDLDALSASQLESLAQDGRATRWQDKAK